MTRQPGTRGGPARVVAVVLVAQAALAACGSAVALPAAPRPSSSAAPTVPGRSSSPIPPDPTTGPAVAVQQRLDALAEKVLGGRKEADVHGLGGLSVDLAHRALDLWWVGEPPGRVRRLAADPPAGITVHVHPAAYDVAAMDRAVKRLMDRYPVIHAASPDGNGGGIEVESTKRGVKTLPGAAELEREAGMPVRVVVSSPPKAA